MLLYVSLSTILFIKSEYGVKKREIPSTGLGSMLDLLRDLFFKTIALLDNNLLGSTYLSRVIFLVATSLPNARR